MSPTMQRRTFLAASAASSLQIAHANDTIRVGVIGCGGRGSYEMRVCRSLKNVRIAAVADVYPPLAQKAVREQAPGAEAYTDFRRILDRSDIDAVFVSTPDHWHAPASILAMQAGKDVYCEKPLTHNIREGRVMTAAARRYNRIVQTGSQQRSAPHYARVCELVRSGYIGKVSMVEAWNYLNQSPAGYGNPPDSDPPAGLNWDLYLGPAPKVPYNRNRFHWNYRWFWDYSGGWMTDWGAHHIDIVHWAMNVDAPLAVTAAGGRFASNDNTETPDTLETLFAYPGFTARYSLRLGNARRSADRPYGITFYGDRGSITVDRASYEVVPEIEVEAQSASFDRLEAFLQGGETAAYVGLNRPSNPKRTPRCEPIKETGIRLDPPIQEAHVQNFFDCMRSRKLPVADVEIGHRTVTACHLGTIAYRTGRVIRWDRDKEQIIGDPEAQQLTTRSLPQTLRPPRGESMITRRELSPAQPPLPHSTQRRNTRPNSPDKPMSGPNTSIARRRNSPSTAKRCSPPSPAPATRTWNCSRPS
jgi:predicted dehydrogenase